MKFLKAKEGEKLTLEAAGNLPAQVHVFEKKAVNAINAALAARRPLLIRGEPGIGKSQLARAAAKKLRRAYLQYVVDSHTESHDLLWHFDAVQRLANAQLSGALGEDKELARENLRVENYLRPGALWWALNWGSAKDQAAVAGELEPPQLKGYDPSNGAVLLIDEIDKAETDVPNGLLEALGEGRFRPMGQQVFIEACGAPPLVIITTNEERALPNAFLRRCLVLYLSLPGQEEEQKRFLIGRGRAHFEKLDDEVLNAAAHRLVADRAKSKSQHRTLLPGQAEYLDLLRAVEALAPGDTASQKERLKEIAGFVMKEPSGFEQ